MKGQQQSDLASAIIAYVTHIEKLGNLTSAIERIAAKHCSLGVQVLIVYEVWLNPNVQAAHYQVVHDVLMESIGQVLGAIVTPEIGEAWSAAVMVIYLVYNTQRKCALY